jgi:nucleoid-associated protein YgaU
MPRDARLGFVAGVTLVILIAVIFYHGDGKASMAGNLGSAKAGSKDANASKALKTPKAAQGRTHVVQEGETLTSIALRYYEDESKATFLYAANRSQVRSIADVPVGTVLIIPDLPPSERGSLVP